MARRAEGMPDERRSERARRTRARKVKYVRRFKRNRGTAADCWREYRVLRPASLGEAKAGGIAGPRALALKLLRRFPRAADNTFAGGAFYRRAASSERRQTRELNVRPRARARKPENRREEDENGIRETVGGEEAGRKAGSRFRRRRVRAFAADRKGESEKAI